MKKILAVLILIPALLYSQKIEVRNDLKKYFDKYGHEGCFVLYDLKNDSFIKYNPDRCKERFIPASTFKIFNSLVGLETGAVKDEYEEMKWDGEKRFIKEWNQDLNMVNAFKYSAVWFYQRMARRIGEEKMKYYVKLNHYGNEDISGGIDMFWLNGGIKISADEQIELSRKLYHNQLNFSERSMEIVKKIMIYDKNDEYTIRAKTGWAMRVEDQIGWFVGYVEKGDNVYFFAVNLQSKNPEEGFVSRKEIAFSILKDFKIIK